MTAHANLSVLQAVTIEDVKRVLDKYILRLFDPASSVAVVVSSPAKADAIAAQLSSCGFAVESRVLDVGAHDEDESGSDSDEDASESDDEAR